MTLATLLQVIRIIFMIGGSTITAKTGVTLDDVETLIPPVVAAAGTVWSLASGVQARRAAQ